MRKLFNKAINAGAAETLKEGTKLIDEIFTTQEEKRDAKKELVKMAVSDRSSAREMYKHDSWLQKAFAIFFLVAWCVLTYVMLDFFVLGNIEIANWQIAIISNINGGISTKLSTIIDFLFGGSISGVNDVKLKNKRKQT